MVRMGYEKPTRMAKWLTVIVAECLARTSFRRLSLTNRRRASSPTIRKTSRHTVSIGRGALAVALFLYRQLLIAAGQIGPGETGRPVLRQCERAAGIR